MKISFQAVDEDKSSTYDGMFRMSEPKMNLETTAGRMVRKTRHRHSIQGRTLWRKMSRGISHIVSDDISSYSGERKKCRIENSLFSQNQKQTKNRFFNGATERYIVSRFALD